MLRFFSWPVLLTKMDENYVNFSSNCKMQLDISINIAGVIRDTVIVPSIHDIHFRWYSLDQ